MTDKDVKDYVKSQLGASWVDVEVEEKDFNTLISMTLVKLAPYYEGHRFVQASGKVIDLSNHKPLAIEKVYNTKDTQIASMNEYVFGGSGVILFDTSFIQRLVSYQSYKMLWNEIKYQEGMNFKLINNTLYLDDYNDSVLIDMLVKPTVVSDVEDTSMYCSWVKEYTLALAKELLGRVRGKFNVNGSPYTLDSAQLLAEAQAEKSNLESQLIGEIFVV
jgi:hypothetical protein